MNRSGILILNVLQMADDGLMGVRQGVIVMRVGRKYFLKGGRRQIMAWWVIKGEFDENE